MTAMAMILTAAMTVPGDGPEKVSGEIVQGLDLGGDFEGTWRHAGGWLMTATSTHQPVLDETPGGIIIGEMPGGVLFIRHASITDEGKGRFRVTDNGVSFLGIYKQSEEQIILCFRPEKERYPTAFQGGKGQHLLILHRVKSRE